MSGDHPQNTLITWLSRNALNLLTAIVLLVVYWNTSVTEQRLLKEEVNSLERTVKEELVKKDQFTVLMSIVSENSKKVESLNTELLPEVAALVESVNNLTKQVDRLVEKVD